MSVPERRLLYKVYQEDGTFVGTFADVVSDLSITKEINGGDGAFSFTLARKIDDFGEGTTIDFNYRIKVYLFDSFNPTGILVAYGYVISYEPYLNGTDEGVTVTCLSAISKLSNDYYRLGTSAVASELGVELKDMRADEMMSTVITHYRSTETNSMIGAPSGLDQTTDNAGTLFEFTLRLFNKKHIEALREISKYFARYKSNGYWFYWRINTAGTLLVKNIAATATHKFVIGKHITNISGSKTIEGLVNRVYFWNEKGTTSSEYVKLTSDDTDSQSEYDVMSEYINDNAVTNTTAASLLASARIYDNKDPKVKIRIELNGDYDLASIEPGQTCQIFNLKNNPYKLGSDSVLFIHSITYNVDSATLEIAEAADDFTNMVDEERNRLTDELTWFGYISQDITASQLGPADRTWSTDIAFTASGDSDAYRKMTWATGSVYLATSSSSSAGKREVAAGDTGNMTAGTDNYIYLNEDTINISATADETGTAGVVVQGGEYLQDISKTWTTNQWQGYIVTVGSQTRVIRANTTTTLYLEESWTIEDTTGAYSIRKWTFDITTDKSAVAASSNVIFATSKANANTNSEASVNSVDGTNVLIDGNTQIAFDSVISDNINSLVVDKLTSGTINSQTITLASATGDCYINAGKTSFIDTTNGFILGIDHADGDTTKFFIGDATHYLLWNGTDLSVFGGNITATAGFIGGWTIGSTTLSSTDNEIVLDSANSKITLASNGIIQSSNYVSGTFGAGFYLDSDLLEVGNISCRGTINTAIFRKDTVSVMGGNFAVLDGDTLVADIMPTDEVLTVKGLTEFAVGDILRIKDGTEEGGVIVDEWLEVLSVDSYNGDGSITYTVERDKTDAYSVTWDEMIETWDDYEMAWKDLTFPTTTWKAGATVVNYKQSGDGGIYMTASEANAPYLSVFDHEGEPWSVINTRMRIGNLNGYLGVSSDLYGIGIGDTTKGYLMYDNTNGLQLFKSNIFLNGGGYVAAGKTAFDHDENGFIMGTDPVDGVVKFLIGTTQNYLFINGASVINTLRISYDIGNVLLHSNDAEKVVASAFATPVEAKSNRVGRYGNYRVKFDCRAINAEATERHAYVRIYKNKSDTSWSDDYLITVTLTIPGSSEVQYSTQTIDINALEKDDTIDILVYADQNVATYTRNFRLYVNGLNEVAAPSTVTA